MEKKSRKTSPDAAGDSSIMQKAGEILSSIGSNLNEAKDAVTQSVIKEFKVVKKAIKKKLAKKKPAPKKAAKKSAKKAAPKKSAKKSASRKPAKKSAPTRRGKR